MTRPESRRTPRGLEVPRKARARRRGLSVATAIAAVAAVAVAALGLAAAGCGSGSSAAPSPSASPSVKPRVVHAASGASIVDAAKAAGLGAFVKAVGAAGLDSALRQNIPYTVLAPNAQAFREVGLEKLIADLPQLKAVMDYHILPAVDLKLERIGNGREVASRAGFPVKFTVKKGFVKVNDAAVLEVVEGPDWSIFVIDKVLTPPVMLTSSSPSP